MKGLKMIGNLITPATPQLALAVLLACAAPAFGESGDQFLDGIGETAMIARYVFDGNENDWSRNDLHGKLLGEEGAYVEDELFGSVLSLPGGRGGGYIQIPGQALIGIDTISVAGWVNLSSDSRREKIFSFGQHKNEHFYCTARDGYEDAGYRVRITEKGKGAEQGTASKSLKKGQWIHLAAVLDTTKKTISSYANGVLVAQATDVTLNMEQILDDDDEKVNLLYIGRGQVGATELNAKLHDFRLYNIALTDEQVQTIRNNSLSDQYRVDGDLASLDLGQLTDRTTDVELNTKGQMGSTIKWQSDNENFVTCTGKLRRPAKDHGQQEVKVTLSATASLKDITKSKTFAVTVPRMPSDAKVVANDKKTLDIGDLSAIIEDIKLDTKGSIGASISWKSNNKKVISTSGKVSRPAPGSGDAKVTLTATVKYGNITETKRFNATVIAMQTDQQIVDADLASIDLGDLAKVTEDMTLPTESKSGSSTISWVSSDQTVISNKGKVTRPMFNDGSKDIVLTVTASKGETSTRKEFNATVRRLADMPILIEVPDVAVETVIGHLPQLPYYVEGVFRDNAKGPLVRVIWPAPRDNSRVAKAGRYVVTGKVSGTDLEVKAIVTIKSAKMELDSDLDEASLKSFALGDVILEKDDKGRDTQFIKNRDKFILTLAKTDPDSFLYNFRDAFGQKQPEGVKPLGVWDTQTCRLRGHASGHYLTAIAQAYASTTYDKELHANFQQKINYLIDTLYDLSQKAGNPAKEGGEFVADPTKVPVGPGKENYDSDLTKEGIRTDYWNWGKGFISGYPPDQFIMLEKGATYGKRNSQVWGPYYTLHKIIAGLLDCYEVGGNEKALTIAADMSIWVYKRLKVLPEATLIKMWNIYIAGDASGMSETMAKLHTITGDERFLEGAKLFDNISFFFGDAKHSHGLAKNVDTIRGKHANQHIPQIIGALETYRASRDDKYYLVSDNFWDFFRNSYMYNIGGVAGAKNPNNGECFTAEPDTIFENGLSKGGQNETCATYNLLKLSRQMFMFDQDGKFMDYYEQGLYNQILASVAENHPGNTYHIPLNPGAKKGYSNPRMEGFTCCNGTAIESSTKLQDSIYFKSKDNKALYVNLYVPSTLTWAESDVVIKQRTSYPYADITTITIEGKGNFEIKVRVPQWATNGFFVKINGRKKNVKAVPGTYLSLKNSWKDGDAIELQMPFNFYLREVMDQPNIAGIFYGPVLLAAEETVSLPDWRPITLDGSDIGKSFTGNPEELRFKSNDLNFKPFYETYDRYSVYFDVTLD